MSKEEFEAIVTVYTYLMDMTKETGNRRTRKEGELEFWLNSWLRYRETYKTALEEYYNKK